MRKYYVVNKTLIILALALVLVVGTNCANTEPSPYVSGLSFTEQPEGGAGRQALSCSFCTFISTTERSFDTSSDFDFGGIYVTVCWMSEDGPYTSEVYTLPWETGRTRYETITTTLTAPAETYLNETYWVEIQWRDAHGEHVQKSDKAQCFTPETT